MVKDFKNKNQWALVLGGSSGLGLATAKKLALHGMNIISIHRNSRAQMDAINDEFEFIRSLGGKCITYNQDAFNEDKRQNLIRQIKDVI